MYHNKFHPLLLTSWRRLIVTEKDGIKSTKLYAVCKIPIDVGSIGSQPKNEISIKYVIDKNISYENFLTNSVFYDNKSIVELKTSINKISLNYFLNFGVFMDLPLFDSY